jgi:hypothetical protein
MKLAGRTFVGPANRLVAPGDDDSSMGKHPPTGTLCIASECMAWRWLDKIYQGDTTKCSAKGFCGLAGKP